MAEVHRCLDCKFAVWSPPEGGWINRREPIAQCPVFQRRDAE